MKSFLLALLLMGSMAIVLPQSQFAQDQPITGQPQFQPAESTSVTDITIPLASVASGTAVLDAVVDNAGKVQSIEVRRDLPSVTEVAVSAIKEWTFSPATLNGKAIPSRVPVAITVRPPIQGVEQVPLPPLKPQKTAAVQAEFQPAEVTRAAFPDYAEGTYQTDNIAVVLEVTLNEEAKIKDVKDVKVLLDGPPATPEAVAALDDWRFLPATLNGQAVPSKVIVVFVFRPWETLR